MQTVLEYLERAQQFERMVVETEDSGFKQLLLDQAAGYRKLAQRRAEQLGMPAPTLDPPRSDWKLEPAKLGQLQAALGPSCGFADFVFIGGFHPSLCHCEQLGLQGAITGGPVREVWCTPQQRQGIASRPACSPPKKTAYPLNRSAPRRAVLIRPMCEAQRWIDEFDITGLRTSIRKWFASD
jgi:hypothetical protein